MNADIRRELGRKAFHLLCLSYLAFFHWQGRAASLRWLAGWIAFVAAVEALRLTRPAVNAFLMRSLGGIHRPEEERRMSGMVWTALGCWLTILAFGDRPRLVSAGILCLAFGDAAAALTGKTLGRHAVTFRGKRKSAEGTLACLAVCAASALAAGFPPGAAAAAAAAAAAVEFAAPLPDDNLWLPLASAFVLSLA
ncbi:MAG: hypothetical protein HYZ75_14510 [Elusimicrobia bacterium]|nr:hypothetical protein [Elusimicrobiota bacterium]